MKIPFFLRSPYYTCRYLYERTDPNHNSTCNFNHPIIQNLFYSIKSKLRDKSEKCANKKWDTKMIVISDERKNITKINHIEFSALKLFVWQANHICDLEPIFYFFFFWNLFCRSVVLFAEIYIERIVMFICVRKKWYNQKQMLPFGFSTLCSKTELFDVYLICRHS